MSSSVTQQIIPCWFKQTMTSDKLLSLDRVYAGSIKSGASAVSPLYAAVS